LSSSDGGSDGRVKMLLVCLLATFSVMTLLGRANWWPGQVPGTRRPAAVPVAADEPALVG
jgi:uncharacterized membrane protein YdfJ with MMPL/SSD domain